MFVKLFSKLKYLLKLMSLKHSESQIMYHVKNSDDKMKFRYIPINILPINFRLTITDKFCN